MAEKRFIVVNMATETYARFAKYVQAGNETYEENAKLFKTKPSERKGIPVTGDAMIRELMAVFGETKLGKILKDKRITLNDGRLCPKSAQVKANAPKKAAPAPKKAAPAPKKAAPKAKDAPKKAAPAQKATPVAPKAPSAPPAAPKATIGFKPVAA